MAKLQAKTKENPKLMQKTLADGRQSLYLEYYMGYNKVIDEVTGKEHIKHIRSKEYLGLYLLPNPRTPEERQKNKETLALAAEIRIDKEKVLVARRYDKSAPVKQKINFLEELQEKRYSDDGRLPATVPGISCGILSEYADQYQAGSDD